MLPLQDILTQAQKLAAAGEAYALATVVRAESPTAAKPGAKALVLADGSIHGWIGGGCAQPAVRKTALECLQDGQSRLIRVRPQSVSTQTTAGVIDFPMSCPSEGTLEIFIDPMLPRPLVKVYGNSAAAAALTALAGQTGFRVAEDTATASAPSFVVIATQGQGDQQALIAALESGAPYIAFIASERKAAKLKQALKDKGLDAQQVDAIHSPAGIDIGAETPEEVALSVLAALVAERRRSAQTMATALATTVATVAPAAVAHSCCSTAKAVDTQPAPADPVAAIQPASCCGGKA